MRTPKPLYAQYRVIYHPELLTCPHCGDLLVSCDYLAWDKIVQTLDQVLSIASRPARCPDPSCPGSNLRLLSARGQQVAIPHSTYGYDVLARIGWLRKEYRGTYGQIHADIRLRVAISESHVRFLSQHVYLPLFACHQRQQSARLAQVAQSQGGLIIALDGLEPEGGEPQLGFVRELQTGLTLRSGWLAQQSQVTFETFLAPLRQLGWPVLAILSDKQTGLVPAVASVFPNRPHQFCQAHYLRNLAEPLAEADSAFKSELRQAVRGHLGALIRQEAVAGDSPSGVLTVTGVVPTCPAAAFPQSFATTQAPSSPRTQETQADAVVNQLLCHTRYLLTLKGRPPFRLAGIETYERLGGVAALSFDLLTHRLDGRLIPLYQGLKAALAPLAQQYEELQHGAVWWRDIADILAPPGDPDRRSAQVAGYLRGYLNTMPDHGEVSPLLHDFRRHLRTVSQSYWPGLFHCYDVPGLYRTNHELESHFRDTQRRLLRTTGQKGQTKQTLHRLGAWELLERPVSEADAAAVWSRIPAEDLARERHRMTQHRQRFRLQVRSRKGTENQFEHLRRQGQELSKNPMG